MFQRDYMLNEARKFAQLLARLMGLKAEGNDEQYLKEFDEALETEYDVELEKLMALSPDEFEVMIGNSGYSTEKLNALGQMLYIFAEPLMVNEITESTLKKVLIVFDLLEKQHHYESFDNLTKRNHIYRFFKDNYERL